MALPVVTVAKGGIPVTAAANGRGTPIEEASNGFGTAVTFVDSGGLPVLGGALTYDPDAVALFARAPALTAPEKASINTRIMRYKAAAVWVLLDALWGFKASAASLLNWKSANYTLTLNGSISQTPNQGLQNAGGYADTGYIPSTAGGNATLNSSLISVWVNNPASGTARFHMGGNDASVTNLQTNASDGVLAYVNQASGAGGITVASTATTTGQLIAQRTGATAFQLSVNGLKSSSALTASTVLFNRNIYIGARNASGNPSGQTSDLYVAAMIGAALTDDQIALTSLADLEYATDEIAWGDSLTAGALASAPSKTYPAAMGDLYSPVRTISNQGVGGQTSTQIAARMGAQPITITATGNQIPASGGVSITAKNINPLFNSGTFTGTMVGTLAGVFGIMSTDASGNWTFTRFSGGSLVACPVGTQFVPSLPEYTRNKTTLLWLGRNGADAGFTVLGDVAAAAVSLPGHARYLVGSILTSTADNAGAIAAVQATNATLASTYGSRYVNVLAALQAANDGSINDLADVAAGYTPRSLRGDALHLNDAGYAIAAATLKSASDALGF